MVSEPSDHAREPAPLPLPDRPKRIRSERRFLAVFWPIAVPCAGVYVWLSLTSGMGLDSFVAGEATIIVALVFVFRSTRIRIARALLKPHGGFVCPRCHYTLSALPDAGECPECGTSYTREGVVALWERAYGLKQRFPRSSARHADPVGAVIPPAPTESVRRTPWTGASLRRVLEQIEAVARAHGYSDARFSAYSLDLERSPACFGVRYPADLYAFLSWVDPNLWSRFVNPSQCMAAAEQGEVGAWIAAQPADSIRVRDPSALRIARMSGPWLGVGTEGPGPDGPSEAITPAEVRLFEFADSSAGGSIMYCMDPTDVPAGGIVTFLPGVDGRVWLADTLAQWLARLAACDGTELAFDRGGSGRVSEGLRAQFREEFRLRNPHVVDEPDAFIPHSN
ncbi:MAG: hypothetical protein KF745_04540 [Phycisphaeraceae bacterium]|nr:hypothetical protein [Phycisphaeraceae bacterium]